MNYEKSIIEGYCQSSLRFSNDCFSGNKLAGICSSCDPTKSGRGIKAVKLPPTEALRYEWGVYMSNIVEINNLVKTYENGLRVIVKEIEYVQSVTMGIMVGAGSAYETAEENGISELRLNRTTFNKTYKFKVV